MEKAKISAGQFFSLIVLFNFGTALVVSLGLQAKKDAWLAILLGTAGGFIFFLIYRSLFRIYPQQPIISYIQTILGKYIGWPLGLLYILFFIYGAARDVRDGGEILTSAILDQTPLLIINLSIIVTIAYVLYKGIEVLVRTAQIYLVMVLGLGIISNLLLMYGGLVHINNLLPVLRDGWKPVLTTFYSQTLSFPFGEMVCFTMLFPLLQNHKQGVKMGFWAVVFSGLVLSYTIALDILVLGFDIAGRASFPLLTMISKINIGEFIQHLDLIVILTLIICNFFKIAVFYYAAVMGTTVLLNLQDYRKMVAPIGIIILYSSNMIAFDFSGHLEEGNFSLITIFPLFGEIIPAILLLIAVIRKKFSQRLRNT
ncbi:spore germination protein [Ectobacillus funiculus]|uniref:GerAB/ArcD/ProY family transporter n=1 Tax=Ectobacillus funiculus TaxID=137993 RepID=UPI00397C1451